MLPRMPATVYRTTKTKAGPGSYSEALGTGTTIYGTWRVHESVTTFIVNRYTDVVPEDVLVVDSAQYRVRKVSMVLTANAKELTLERVDAPIYPVSEASTS